MAMNDPTTENFYENLKTFIDCFDAKFDFLWNSQTIERHFSTEEDEDSYLQGGPRSSGGESTLNPGPGLRIPENGSRKVKNFSQIFLQEQRT